MLDAVYTFGPGPGGTFNDVRFKSGADAPVTLASFQFDAETKTGHRRFGSTPGDCERLFALLLTVDRSTESRPLEVEVRLLEEDDPHRDNPKFYPRVSLDLNGQLVAVARTPEEAMLVLNHAIFVAKNPDRLPKGEVVMFHVPGGAPHTAKVMTRDEDELRIAAKVALGAATFVLGAAPLSGPALEFVRAFVRQGGAEHPAARTLPGKELEGFSAYHLALIQRVEARLSVLVVLFGYCYEVELGASAGEDLVAGIASRWDGSATFTISSIEATAALRAIKGASANSEE